MDIWGPMHPKNCMPGAWKLMHAFPICSGEAWCSHSWRRGACLWGHPWWRPTSWKSLGSWRSTRARMACSCCCRLTSLSLTASLLTRPRASCPLTPSPTAGWCACVLLFGDHVDSQTIYFTSLMHACPAHCLLHASLLLLLPSMKQEPHLLLWGKVGIQISSDCMHVLCM